VELNADHTCGYGVDIDPVPKTQTLAAIIEPNVRDDKTVRPHVLGNSLTITLGLSAPEMTVWRAKRRH
jgi:hypothetical protein